MTSDVVIIDIPFLASFFMALLKSSKHFRCSHQ